MHRSCANCSDNGMKASKVGEFNRIANKFLFLNLLCFVLDMSLFSFSHLPLIDDDDRIGQSYYGHCGKHLQGNLVNKQSSFAQMGVRIFLLEFYDF